MRQPIFKVKVLVVDSDPIVEGFRDKELLQKWKVGDIMGMQQDPPPVRCGDR